MSWPNRFPSFPSRTYGTLLPMPVISVESADWSWRFATGSIPVLRELIPPCSTIPNFATTPSKGVGRRQQALEAGDSETARDAFHQAFEHARDSSQTVRAAASLARLGEQVDIAEHLGLVVDWWLVGPFDAPRFSGFDSVFPPEKRSTCGPNTRDSRGRRSLGCGIARPTRSGS